MRSSSSSASGSGDLRGSIVLRSRCTTRPRGPIARRYGIERAASGATATAIPFGDGRDVDGHPARAPLTSARTARPAEAGRHPGRRLRTESWLGVPIRPATGSRRDRLESIEQHAFDEADERLLEHARDEHGRRPRERPPVRRDEAAPDRDQRAGRRAGPHQRRPARAGREPRHPGDVRPRGRQDQRDLRRPGRRHRRSAIGRPAHPLPVHRSSVVCGSRRRRSRCSGSAGTSSRPARRC